ncbi:HTH-type transcriptional regulator / antitoxin HigA [Pseudomonas luteola]|nr:HTH-type transcriptional regulator / antitoxin HigA [Pseudomonas zeshuii]
MPGLARRQNANLKNLIMSALLKQVIEHWDFVAPLLQKPKNDDEYRIMAESVDELLEIIGRDENHPLKSLLLRMADLLEAYDAETYPDEPSDPRGMLAFLMEQHKLRQSDLPEVGTQSVVSEILSGKRELNVRQIKALCERFGCSPAVFMP